MVIYCRSMIQLAVIEQSVGNGYLKREDPVFISIQRFRIPFDVRGQCLGVEQLQKTIRYG